MYEVKDELHTKYNLSRMVFCDQTNFVLVLVTEEGVAALRGLELFPGSCSKMW